MKELDINKLISLMDKPETTSTVNSFMEMLGQADRCLKQIEIIFNRLDTMGLKPLLVRGAGIKLGIDAETPLKSDYLSKTHKEFIEKINKISEEDLKKQLQIGEKENDNPT